MNDMQKDKDKMGAAFDSVSARKIKYNGYVYWAATDGSIVGYPVVVYSCRDVPNETTVGIVSMHQSWTLAQMELDGIERLSK